MIDDIIILDNVVSSEYQEHVRRSIMESNIPWNFRPNLGNDTPVPGSEMNPAPGIIHVCSNAMGIQSELFYTLLPVAEMACQKIDFRLSGVIGCRTFIQFPSLKDVGFTKIHTDVDTPHLVCLYYVIDADGDTILFDKTTDEIPKNQLDPSKLNIVKRITPKKGTAVLFNGNRYHCTTLPMKGQRCIINFNLR